MKTKKTFENRLSDAKLSIQKFAKLQQQLFDKEYTEEQTFMILLQKGDKDAVVNILCNLPVSLSKHFTQAELVRIVSCKYAAVNLTVLNEHVSDLIMLEYTPQQLVLIVSRCGGAENLESLVKHGPTLTGWGFSKEQLVRSASHGGGSHNLKALVDCSPALVKLGLRYQQLVQIVSHDGGSKVLIALVEHANIWEAFPFSREQLVPLISKNGGFQVLMDLINHVSSLTALGFTDQDIRTIVNAPGGGSHKLEVLLNYASALTPLGFTLEQLVHIVINRGSDYDIASLLNYTPALIALGFTFEHVIIILGSNGGARLLAALVECDFIPLLASPNYDNIVKLLVQGRSGRQALYRQLTIEQPSLDVECLNILLDEQFWQISEPQAFELRIEGNLGTTSTVVIEHKALLIMKTFTPDLLSQIKNHNISVTREVGDSLKTLRLVLKKEFGISGIKTDRKKTCYLVSFDINCYFKKIKELYPAYIQPISNLEEYTIFYQQMVEPNPLTNLNSFNQIRFFNPEQTFEEIPHNVPVEYNSVSFAAPYVSLSGETPSGNSSVFSPGYYTNPVSLEYDYINNGNEGEIYQTIFLESEPSDVIVEENSYSTDRDSVFNVLDPVSQKSSGIDIQLNARRLITILSPAVLAKIQNKQIILSLAYGSYILDDLTSFYRKEFGIEKMARNNQKRICTMVLDIDCYFKKVTNCCLLTQPILNLADYTKFYGENIKSLTPALLQPEPVINTECEPQLIGNNTEKNFCSSNININADREVPYKYSNDRVFSKETLSAEVDLTTPDIQDYIYNEYRTLYRDFSQIPQLSAPQVISNNSARNQSSYSNVYSQNSPDLFFPAPNSSVAKRKNQKENEQNPKITKRF